MSTILEHTNENLYDSLNSTEQLVFIQRRVVTIHLLEYREHSLEIQSLQQLSYQLQVQEQELILVHRQLLQLRFLHSLRLKGHIQIRDTYQ